MWSVRQRVIVRIAGSTRRRKEIGPKDHPDRRERSSRSEEKIIPIGGNRATEAKDPPELRKPRNAGHAA